MPPSSNTGPSNQSTTIAELVSRLDARARGERCALAFDGDGTLWAGDVSDDVFRAACRQEWILPALHPIVEGMLNRHGLSTDGTTSELTYRLFESEKLGKIDERLLFEVMTWCYAGRGVDELSAFAERALSEAGIDSRVRHGYRQLLDWANAAGHLCWIVTASPWPIVRVAAKRLGFSGAQIIASSAIESETGIIGTALAAPVPYRDQKVLQLDEKRNGARLLAAFGDSHFDVDLLRAAEVAVAVAPKTTLLRQLDTMDQAVVLEI